jgi:hypothetical protein
MSMGEQEASALIDHSENNSLDSGIMVTSENNDLHEKGNYMYIHMNNYVYV